MVCINGNRDFERTDEGVCPYFGVALQPPCSYISSIIEICH
ncbi:hypothetical protein HMPREF0973_00694 [Prevotella veroralis F0319]|uniref:Uncharacterized protein n=1 Tax=Prevotella veroralis F0319 TaxID=649761 RepID=C9MM65_9BACT|nr:hypothetical protein HMPREF0973_00694 [Prevotella veroralis F0319]